MSLLGDIAAKASGLLGAQGGQLQTLSGLEQVYHQLGGVTGIQKTFEEKGFGGLVSSWIGTGQNLPLSQDQLKSVLGEAHLNAISQKIGMTPDQLGQKIASVLPEVVNVLTPQGQVPSTGISTAQLLEVGKKFLN